MGATDTSAGVRKRCVFPRSRPENPRKPAHVPPRSRQQDSGTYLLKPGQSCGDGLQGGHAAKLVNPSRNKKAYSSVNVHSRTLMDCTLCSSVQSWGWSRYSDTSGGWPVDIAIEVRLDGIIPTDVHWNNITIGLHDGDEYRHEHFANDVPDLLPAPFARDGEPILDAGVARDLELARHLLVECEKGHERCRMLSIPLEKPLLPTRLVDCTDPDHPRLVRTDERKHIRYLALSYVWGTEEQPHKTIRSKLSTYENGIALVDLPRTIQDAIRVTHELGFDLLWVDSLCIIQDEDKDKEDEIGRMHHIFRHAALTIVAARAHAASHGFLHDDSLSRCHPSSRSTTVAHLGLNLSFYPKSTISPFWAEYASEPVSKRAWCLQEYLMSLRSLVFTSSGTLQFRCQTTTRNIGNKAFYRLNQELRLPDAILRPSTSPGWRDNDEWIHLHHMWGMIIDDYTSRDMTNPEDKLVACAAIAQAFGRVLCSDYLAGLWRDSLLNDLLWIAKEIRRRPPGESRAPSWSWAAVDGRVSMRRIPNGNHDIAEVLMCKVWLKYPSLQIRQVYGGLLALSAQLLRVQLNEQEGRIRFSREASSLRDFEGDHSEVAAARSDRWHDVSWTASYDASDDTSSMSSPGPSFHWAIPLVLDTQGVRGLIVTRAPGPDIIDSSVSKTPYYRRIGSFRDMKCKNATENEEVLLRLFQNRKAFFEEIKLV